MTIREMQERAYANAKAKGFHDTLRSLESALMLIVTEIAEVAEEVRRADFDPLEVRYREDGKPEGFGPELADIVIRCADTAESLHYQLEIHGRAVDGDWLEILFGMTRAATSDDLDAVCSKCFAVAKANDLDIWALIEEKMTYNETRPRMHGKRA